ncbi:cytochrome b561 and DOMON domain-containing protein At5g47530-like [Rhodamnia argentea]|uniref:Cytochrome b561 and DOMON domain-containing protein At5g47530-like n=1 Tax=Rhodamnia argentea TaxID=178133 RepID=A0A8B8PY26_9MYRT|nr:cytochrome b561 and DOMON domain-containing protein At5g47530-like [Rhodamnia argentea]
MAGPKPILFTLCIVLCSLHMASSQADSCANHTFSSDKAFDSCTDLPVLGAHLHWTYNPAAASLHVAYRASQSPSGWIAWAINPTGTGMVGSQAIVAFQNSDGTMNAYTTPIDSYSPSMGAKELSFRVSNVTAEYTGGEMTIFAVVGPLGNGTTGGANQVWQAGDSVVGGVPQAHAASGDNVKSMGTIDFVSK